MKKLTKLFLILTILLTINYQLLTINSALAAETDLGPLSGLGFYMKIPSDPAAAFTKIASVIVGTLTAVAGLWMLFQFLAGGLTYITAGGDKANTEKARSQITNAVIGLLIVVAAWSIVFLISSITGINILQPEKILPKLSPTYTAPGKDTKSKEQSLPKYLQPEEKYGL